jgi:hypothetical protein
VRQRVGARIEGPQRGRTAAHGADGSTAAAGVRTGGSQTRRSPRPPSRYQRTSALGWRMS